MEKCSICITDHSVKTLCLSRNHPSDTSAPTGYLSRTENLTKKNMTFQIHLLQVLSIMWKCFKNSLNLPVLPSAPSIHHEYLAVICILTDAEISSDNDLMLAGGKVEPLWLLEMIIMCSTVLILMYSGSICLYMSKLKLQINTECNLEVLQCSPYI